MQEGKESPLKTSPFPTPAGVEKREMLPSSQASGVKAFTRPFLLYPFNSHLRAILSLSFPSKKKAF